MLDIEYLSAGFLMVRWAASFPSPFVAFVLLSQTTLYFRYFAVMERGSPFGKNLSAIHFTRAIIRQSIDELMIDTEDGACMFHGLGDQPIDVVLSEQLNLPGGILLPLFHHCNLGYEGPGGSGRGVEGWSGPHPKIWPTPYVSIENKEKGKKSWPK
jgi:hypothetical protein